MNRTLISITILLFCFLPACSPAEERYIELEPHAVEAGNQQTILILVDHGEVTILESRDKIVEIGGQVLDKASLEYHVSSTERQISIKVFAHQDNHSAPPLRVILHIPKQLQTRVETDNASIHVQDYSGNLEVVSTSGNIVMDRVDGRLTLRSNRGNIIVREGSGDVGIAGNYGAIKIQNVRGETDASTIMGNIELSGLISSGDIVRLETDHGGVSVNLSRDSALTLRVHSTSGDVACILPNLSSSLRSCGGEFNSGGGTLSIRTVSGAVTLELIP